MAAAVSSLNGSRNPGNAHLHIKARIPEHLGSPLAGVKLLVRAFGVFPNFIRQILNNGAVFFKGFVINFTNNPIITPLSRVHGFGTGNT